MIQHFTCLGMLVSGCLVAGRAAKAESWPDLDDLASPRFLLIAHCRTEAVHGRVLYKVLDVWKGEYSPAAFVKQPPTGYIDAMGFPEAPRDRVAGANVILFYTRGNQPPAWISRPDMMVAVQDGKLKYPPGKAELFSGQRNYTLSEFKREITSRIGKAATDAGQAVERAAARRASDYSGPWRMLLPGGFDLEASFEALAENRYRFKSGGSRFNGVYEVRGKRLVIVEPIEPRLEGFVWEIRSPWMLTLIEQSEKLEHDYRGAVLFRPSQPVLKPTTTERHRLPLTDQASGDKIKLEYRRGFHTAGPAEFLRKYWDWVQDDGKMQGLVSEHLTKEQIDTIYVLEVHIAIAQRDPMFPSLQEEELLAFMTEGNRFQTGPLPEGFEKEPSAKFLVALFRTKKGDYGLITRYSKFAVVELAGYVGVAPVAPGARIK